MSGIAPALLLLTAATQQIPSGQYDWRWSREGVGCSLQQVYSIDGKVVSVSRTPANDQTSIAIGSAEPIFAPPKDYPGGKVTFFPGGQADAEIYVATQSKRREVFALSHDPNFLGKLGKASEFEFVQEKLGKIRVPLRSAAAAVQALRDCEDSRMREWGIDPVAWRALQSRPVPTKNWTEWLRTDDYPVGAILAGNEGFVISRLDVGPDGVARTCVPLNRNRAKQQRSPICDKLKKRARFKPALDSNGNPVAAPYVLIIQFRLA